jgi:hypothetical protein
MARQETANDRAKELAVLNRIQHLTGHYVRQHGFGHDIDGSLMLNRGQGRLKGSPVDELISVVELIEISVIRPTFSPSATSLIRGARKIAKLIHWGNVFCKPVSFVILRESDDEILCHRLRKQYLDLTWDGRTPRPGAPNDIEPCIRFPISDFQTVEVWDAERPHYTTD